MLIHTGQNYDPNLKDIFFDELGIRKPDWCYNETQEKTKPFEVIGEILKQTELALTELDIDRVLILGDTNSGLSAIVAKRYGIPVYHMEAGNRCFRNTPEEINRRVIDACSDVWMPYTERSRQNLLREGIPPDKIYVIGNPIGEVLAHYSKPIAQSNILHTLGVLPGHYYLVTMHRAENVDIKFILLAFVKLLRILAEECPVIVSVHPHTKKQLEKFLNDETFPRNVYMHEPFGFFDFVYLEKNALCVLSDSGTVQEECAILGIPNVTLREVTERPETIEHGCGCIGGYNIERLKAAISFAKSMKHGGIPERYMDQYVSTTVLRILLGV